MGKTDISITLTGLPELKSKLNRLSDATRGQTLERALVSGALLVANAAKEKAPWKTGNLRRSIHVGGEGVKGGLEQPTTGTDIGGKVSGSEFAEVLVGTNVEYAAQREFGGTIVAKNAPYLVFKTYDGAWHKVKSVTQPARPYLRPAFDEQRENVIREVKEALADLLRAI